MRKKEKGNSQRENLMKKNLMLSNNFTVIFQTDNNNQATSFSTISFFLKLY